ncbi:hypothetical protein M885DRAFT_506784 [Pelagophyceae sp. CCMP2097]|nr:hypothetical protein M885DRAFT_506784 [Pelagophyceae sp. CCMP2097]
MFVAFWCCVMSTLALQPTTVRAPFRPQSLRPAPPPQRVRPASAGPPPLWCALLLASPAAAAAVESATEATAGAPAGAGAGVAYAWFALSLLAGVKGLADKIKQ